MKKPAALSGLHEKIYKGKKCYNILDGRDVCV